MSAELYTVTLTSGATFQTRYQPEEAPWDAQQVLLRTDLGNWISLPRAEIVSAVAETENKGFGRVIDSNTVELGMTANDMPTAEEMAANPQNFQQMFPQEEPYNIQQFVEPTQTQGIPGAYVTGYGGPQLFPQQRAVPQVIAVPQIGAGATAAAALTDRRLPGASGERGSFSIQTSWRPASRVGGLDARPREAGAIPARPPPL